MHTDTETGSLVQRPKWPGWMGALCALVALACAVIAFHILEPRPKAPEPKKVEPAATETPKTEAPKTEAPKTEAETDEKSKKTGKLRALARRAKSKAAEKASAKVERKKAELAETNPGLVEVVDDVDRSLNDEEYQRRVRILMGVGLMAGILGIAFGLLAFFWAKQELGRFALIGSTAAVVWIVVASILSLVLVVLAAGVLLYLLVSP